MQFIFPLCCFNTPQGSDFEDQGDDIQQFEDDQPYVTSNLHDSDYDEENVADDDIEGSDYEYHPHGDDKHDVSDAECEEQNAECDKNDYEEGLQVDEDEKQENEEEGQCFSDDQQPANEEHVEEKSSEEYQHAGIDKNRTTSIMIVRYHAFYTIII